MLARMVGHITYLSDSAMRAKFVPTSSDFGGNFGRDLRSGKLSFGFNVDSRWRATCVIRVSAFPKTSTPIPIC